MGLARYRYLPAATAVRRQARRFRCSNHARQSRDFLEDYFEEDALLLGVVVAARRKRNTRSKNVLGIKAQIDVFEREQAAHHQACGHEHDDRERDLRHHERGAKLAVTKTPAQTLSAIGQPR